VSVRALMRVSRMAIALALLGLVAAKAAADEPAEEARARLYPIVRHAKIGAVDASGREVIAPVNDTLDAYTVENWRRLPRVPDIIWQWSSWTPIEIADPAHPIVFAVDGSWGFLSADGSVAIAPVFERVRPFGLDVPLAPVRLDDRWGYIGRDGATVIEPRFADAYSFTGRLAPARVGEAWGLIGPDGDWVVAPTLDTMPRPAREGLFPISANGKWGYMAADGGIAIAPRFDAATTGTRFSEGLANVYLDGKMGFVDARGDFVIPPVYDVASPFMQGVASVERDGQCGYVTMSGDLVVPLGRYDICHAFFGPLARVARTSRVRGVAVPRWGYIDTAGRELVPIGLDGADTFHEGLAAVEQGGRGGYIDASGALVIALGHNGIVAGRGFVSGLAPAAAGGRGRLRWGYVDRQGEWAIPATFADAGVFRGELAFVETNDSVGLVDRRGRLVFEVDLADIAP